MVEKISDQINTLYELFETPEYFLGVFENKFYRITRKYLSYENSPLRIYYTKMEPLKVAKKASLVLIHGFGEHSCRFLDFGEAFV